MSDAQQKEAIEKLSKLKVGALFMEMGTGKTKVALDLIDSKKHKVDYVLWICPYSLKGEIEEEKEKWHPDLKIDIVGCESIGSSDRIYLDLLNKVNGKRTFIVVDESLKIKNISAQRTKRILSVGEAATYKLILNGTPISRNILDLWTQMDFLSPKILNMSYREFKDTYCEYYVRGPLRGVVKRQVNIPHLISLISPYIYESKLTLDVEQFHSTVYYDIDSYEEYQRYKNRIFDEYFDYDNREGLNFNAFSMKLQRYYCKNSNKKETISKLIEQIGDKVIVFVKFTESIPENAHRLTGAENQQQRKEIIKAFKNGDFDVLYITYGCGAYGLNLQFCHNIVFAEQVWDYALQVQAEARIFRLGQQSKVHYYHMICDKIGLEAMISECLSRKTGLLATIKKEIEGMKGVKEWVKSL